MSSAAEGPGLVLGVIIPCRNEAAVIERKLLNLAHGRWPFSKAPHQIVIVDDGSTDGTAERAAALAARIFPKAAGTNRMSVPGLSGSMPAAARVVANAGSPGKAGAIRHAMELLAADGVDLLVLTDADVVLRPPSLLNLEHAFRTRPELGMACGRQELVESLNADGSCRGADGKDPVPAAEPYDRWTAAIRRWESARGRLFSVHGQLLAWRAALGVAPSPGVAADDLDLMFQVRRRGLRIEMLPGPCFLEIKPSAGGARREQQLRRAAAWFQISPGLRSPANAPLAEKLQLAAYKLGPRLLMDGGWTVLGLLALVCGVILLGLWSSGALWGLGAFAGIVAMLVVLPFFVWLAFLASPGGRQLASLLAIVRQAARERSPTASDRWERPGR